MILSFAITVLIESIVIVGYSYWRRKPLIHFLLSGFFVNLVTQTTLWIFLNIFPDRYLTILLFSESCIWWIEGLVLYFYPYNKLKLGEALALSLGMNLASFAIGWFLPV
ncbi:MAG: hypothetical protein ABIF04_05965 [Chloroflexota bacterium]